MSKELCTAVMPGAHGSPASRFYCTECGQNFTASETHKFEENQHEGCGGLVRGWDQIKEAIAALDYIAADPSDRREMDSRRLIRAALESAIVTADEYAALQRCKHGLRVACPKAECHGACCSRCDGTGRVFGGEPCQKCSGTGDKCPACGDDVCNGGCCDGAQ